MAKKVVTSGFVYIWFDKKHKRFYVGSHWGNPNDKYICSSTWMRNAYNRRPEDFKRRILETVHTNKADLYECEYQWLSLIKDEELGKRYYNLMKDKYVDVFNPTTKSEKISRANKGKKQSPESVAKRAESIRKTMSTPEKKEELSLQALAIWDTPGHREFMSNNMVELWKTEEHREKIVPKLIEAQNRPEVKAKVSATSSEYWQDPEHRRLQSERLTGITFRPHTEEENLLNSEKQKEVWASEGYKEKWREGYFNSETAHAASKANIRKTHTPEAKAKSKETNRIRREQEVEFRKNNPEAAEAYRIKMHNQAMLGAMKRWHPESLVVTEEIK